VWAEFYLQGLGWVPVDPSYGPKNNAADAFGKLDNRRLTFNPAYNVSLVPEPQWISLPYDILQTYTWEYWCNSGNEKTVTVNLSYESSEVQGK
jgi:transglutaminase-like putative cysteine protease